MTIGQHSLTTVQLNPGKMDISRKYGEIFGGFRVKFEPKLLFLIPVRGSPAKKR
jgi:hypothetical protein